MNMKPISEHDSDQLSALLDDTLPAAQAAALRQRLQHDEAHPHSVGVPSGFYDSLTIVPAGDEAAIEPAGEMWSVVMESPRTASARAPAIAIRSGCAPPSSKKGGFLEHPELFDPEAFGIAPRDWREACATCVRDSVRYPAS